ncbi:hypothetical protein JTB14_027810 [Gonioctena quinquepunctata]|nr:hypothetical protein JTB14_027810 [Gonioctena quinquepunctata]
MTITDRVEKIKSIKLCLNYLKVGHYSKYCRLGHCKRCNRKHNVLLHVEPQSSEPERDSQTTLTAMNSKNYVLLSTAHVKVLDIKGNTHIVRTILDSGSQSSFITRSLSEKLNLRKEETNMSVFGLSQNMLELTHKWHTPSQLLKFVDFTNNTCPLCLKTFNRKDHVQRHYMELHMTPKVFECNKCHKKYKRRYLLDHHEKNCIEDVKVLQCFSCKITFNSRGKLVAHMKQAHHLDMILQ